MNLAKIILLSIGILVLAGCAVGWVLTSQTLGSTESRLDNAQADVADLQQELQETRDSLSNTQDELQDTVASLSETQGELEKQINETNNYIDMYENTREGLKDTENELESVSDDLLVVELRNERLEEDIAEIQEQLDLYIDTLGTQVFSGIISPGRSGNSIIILENNSDAKDPTWQELLAFLREDKTDKNLYVSGEYECGNFAQELHNNAEATGIRTAFVAIHYYNADSHAVNAFKTTDRGLVYVDVTGSTVSYPIPYMDKKVIIAKDEIYTASFIFPSAGWYIPPGYEKVQSIEIYW